VLYIKNGTHDAYNPTSGTATNLLISSWYGISFPTYDGTSRVGFNTRNGDAYFGGRLNVKTGVFNTGKTAPSDEIVLRTWL